MAAFQSQPIGLRTMCYGFAAGNTGRLIAAKAFSSSAWSDRRIARLVGVGNATVSRWRREWARTLDLAREAERELGHELQVG